ncbi:MAG: glycosyl transferase family 2 [Cellvibrionales bacterium]|nr:MAG: glycosyl transferase family 2 [Cellvibrionales bacterium]
MPTLPITIVICTHNRSELLMHAISSINASIRPSDCEISIMVVANACSDATVAELDNYIKNQAEGTIPLVYFEEPQAGKSFALNLALSKLERGFTCFIDDDQRVDSNFLVGMTNTLSTYPDCSFFCGNLIPDWTGEEASWIHDTGPYRVFPLPVPHFDPGNQVKCLTLDDDLPSGGNLIIKTDLLNKIGDFEVKLGPQGHNLMGGEDSEYVRRILNSGATLIYSPDITQYHYVDPDRLRLRYLITLSFQRSRAITLVNNPQRAPIPRYIWRKLFNYSANILFSLSLQKKRFYLMRFAATLGEATGFTSSSK